MSQQMSFMLQEIDRIKTKKRIEKVFEQYRMHMLQVDTEFLPKVTTSFTLTPPTFNNAFHSSTEDVAIKNIEFHENREIFIRKIHTAINRLTLKEREIIIKCYMGDDEYYDYEIYNEMGYSERKYYRMKSRAIYKLAFALKEEVYVQGGQAVSGE